MPSLPQILQASKELGVHNLTQFAIYQAKLRSGWFRFVNPSHEWDQNPLERWVHRGVPTTPTEYLRYREESERDHLFFFSPQDDLQQALAQTFQDLDQTIVEADEILGGGFRLFGGPTLEMGFPPAWGKAGKNEAGELPLSGHWSTVQESSVRDIKLVWEASRFAWVYPLARAFRLSGDERYAGAFWTLVASWREHNPPNTGPNWYSAQEVALRLLATTFGCYAFAPYLRQAPQRCAVLADMLAAFADRIPFTLAYARSQANNHLLSEGCALYTAGLLFPEFKQAGAWKQLGRKWLLAGLREQVFQDGGYTQHSSNYHRLALSLGLWAGRLAELNQEPFPQEIIERLGSSAICLLDQVDPRTGLAMNFGHNDGSHLLPLSSCQQGDYRPLLQAAGKTFLGDTFFPAGPWDELLVWLGLMGKTAGKPGSSPMVDEGSASAGGIKLADRDPLSAFERSGMASRLNRTYPLAGLIHLRGLDAWAALRCAHFLSRPAHSDQLNLDLWWHGENIIRDEGSYSYNSPAPWDNPFSGAGSHNAPVIDDDDPMQRAGTFLWLHWAQARPLIALRSATGRLELVSAEHDGYRRQKITVRRTVLRAGDDLWLILDDLYGAGQHTCQWNWTLPDWDWSAEQTCLRLRAGIGEVRIDTQVDDACQALFRAGDRLIGDQHEPLAPTRGWISPTYHALEPALSWRVKAIVELPVRISTWICFNQADQGELEVEYQQIEPELPALRSVGFGQEQISLVME